MLDQCTLLPDSVRNSRFPVQIGETVQNPAIEIVYVYVAHIHAYKANTLEFVESYLKNPPEEIHSTTIVCNGGEPNGEMKNLFNMIPNVSFLMHDNRGYDIGGFQHASRVSKADLMLFLGASTYFNGQGWLKRVKQSYLDHGDALYGTMGNRGDAGVKVNRHIRSTAFWMTPHLFNQYPINVVSKEQRYEFEHRTNCLTEWAIISGVKAYVVGWKGEYEWEDWDSIPNGFHRGNQSNLIIGDHISRPPFYPPKK